MGQRRSPLTYGFIIIAKRAAGRFRAEGAASGSTEARRLSVVIRTFEFKRGIEDVRGLAKCDSAVLPKTSTNAVRT